MAAKRRRKMSLPYDPRAVRFINPAQVGGIETAVLDDGPGRGVRIAWVNTGTPLRYKVLIDRGLDIADAFYGALSLSFLSLTGPTAPTRALDKGLDWLSGFYGGLVCSCGPQHVGGPETVDVHGIPMGVVAQSLLKLGRTFDVGASIIDLILQSHYRPPQEGQESGMTKGASPPVRFSLTTSMT